MAAQGGTPTEASDTQIRGVVRIPVTPTSSSPVEIEDAPTEIEDEISSEIAAEIDDEQDGAIEGEFAPLAAEPEDESAPLTVECAVCGATCIQTGADGIFEHGDAPCVSILVDANGDSLDRQYFIAGDGLIYEVTRAAEEAPPVPAEDVVTEVEDDDEVYEDQLPVLADAPPPPAPRKRKPPTMPPPPPDAVVSPLPAGAVTTADGLLMLPTERDPSILPIDQGMLAIFQEHGLERLGGASGDLGWSSFSTYQRCPYLFKRLYIDGLRDAEGRPPIYIEIGAAVHAFLALHYQKLIDPNYPITPDSMYKGLLDAGCDAQALLEAWRLWSSYALWYEQDFIVPLAVEYHVVDPETKESARYDLIAKVEKPDGSFQSGTYIVEHKTASRFDEATLNGWQNDGEVIGQMMLWHRLKLNRKFGKLQGVMMNIIGKQKISRFHRSRVIDQRWQIKQHANDLRQWQGLRLFQMASGVFPRARANCVGRYGMCSQWEHCAHRE